MKDELYSGFWVDYYEAMFPASANAKRAKFVIDLIKKFKPDAKNMLELASGTGNWTVYWMKKFDVKGTDLSSDMLARARTKCPKVTFEKVSMTDIAEPAVYDVVTCMWESFRYLEDFRQVDKTLKNVANVLKPGGLFITDFHHFPPKDGWTEIEKKNVKVDGMEVQETLKIKTENEYDVRKSIMTIKHDGMERIEEVKRSPFLRISPEHMKKHLEAAGFELVYQEREFQDSPYSYLYVAKKV